jgi:T6SS, Phospholipase effector Tle1-like, catalytic domain
LFVNEFPDERGIKAETARQFYRKNGQRSCLIHFLGLWDTVKSYGGLKPVMLPHLRHNPSVSTVRHALSLDERRGWFEVTTWGWLDSDQANDAAMSRLDPRDIEKIREQDVMEVWFSGCHADVGGGRKSECSSEIASRWMLGEARHADLRLNSAGEEFLASEDKPCRAKPSRTLFWKAVELYPRFSITNAGRWPAYEDHRKKGASPRDPLKSKRKGTIWYHKSVKDLSGFGAIPPNVRLEPRPTLQVPAAAKTG